MNSRLQKQLEGLSARVAKLQEDFGVVKKGFGVAEKIETDCPFCGKPNAVEKSAVSEGMQKIRCSHCAKLWEQDMNVTAYFAKSTAANDPPEPWIDGVRELVDRLNAAAIIRANEDTRSALLRDAGFLALMRQMQKNPSIQVALLESIQRAEHVAGGPEEEEMDEPTEPYDHQAFQEARERGRRLHLGREAMKMPVVVKRFVENIQAIADDLAAGGKGVSASDVAKMTEGAKQDKEPMVDFGLQKSATDTTKVDVRSLGRPRRMNQSEVLR